MGSNRDCWPSPPRASVVLGGPDLQTRDKMIGVLRSYVETLDLRSSRMRKIILDKMRKMVKGGSSDFPGKSYAGLLVQNPWRRSGDSEYLPKPVAQDLGVRRRRMKKGG